MLEVFEDLRFDHDRILDLDDRIVALGTFRGRGRVSGMEFGPAPFAIVITLRDGKMMRFEWFASAEDALRAAGVPQTLELSGAASRQTATSASSASATIRMTSLVAVVVGLDALDLEGGVERVPCRHVPVGVEHPDAALRRTRRRGRCPRRPPRRR